MYLIKNIYTSVTRATENNLSYDNCFRKIQKREDSRNRCNKENKHKDNGKEL